MLWLLESSEPPVRSRFELTIGGRDTEKLKPAIEHALSRQGVTYVLLGSSPHELHYEVTVPFQEQIRKLTKLIRGLAGRRGTLGGVGHQETEGGEAVKHLLLWLVFAASAALPPRRPRTTSCASR